MLKLYNCKKNSRLFHLGESYLSQTQEKYLFSDLFTNMSCYDRFKTLIVREEREKGKKKKFDISFFASENARKKYLCFYGLRFHQSLAKKK